MSVHDVVAKHLSETPDAAELRRLAEACPMPDNDPDTFKDWYEFEDLAERNYHIRARGGNEGGVDGRDVVLGLLNSIAHMAEARDNARTEVERLTALLAEVRATAEHYNGQAYANCSAAILRILDGERIKHWHDLRPGETVYTDCWLAQPDGACDR